MLSRVVLRPPGGPAEREGHRAEALGWVNGLSRQLAGAESAAALAERLVDLALEGCALDGAAVLLGESFSDRLVLAAQRGLPRGLREALKSVASESASPASDAAHRAERLAFDSAEALAARYPEAAPSHLPFESVAAIPFGPAGTAVLVACAERRGAFEPEILERLDTLALHAANALEKRTLAERAARSEEDARRLHESLGFLSRASELLGQSLEEEATLRKVAQLAVGELADACAIWMAEPEGAVVPVEVAHRDPDQAAALRALLQRFPVRVDSIRGLGRVVRGGKSELVEVLTDDHLAALSRHPDHLALLHRFRLKSAIAVPLVARGGILGALVLAAVGERRALSARDLPIAEELARRAALAVDNARLYRREQAARARAQTSEAKAALLAEMSNELSRSFDYRATLARAARLLVPGVAEWCMVDLVGEDGRVERVAVVHADPAKDGLAQVLKDAPPSLDEPDGLAQVLRSGLPLLVRPGQMPDIDSRRRLASHAVLLRRLGLVSAMAVPLVARSRVLGAFTFLKGPQARRHFNDSDLAFAREIAARAAVTVDNALLYDDAQREIRLRESFLSIASHELKTPLTSMSLNVQGLRRMSQRTDLGQDAWRTRLGEKLEATERQTRRLAALVDELLDVTRINAGRLELQLEETDLSALVREVAERFELLLEQAGCALTLEIPEPVSGRWDRSRLEQVLTNLLQNAVKYGPNGPVRLMVRKVGGEAVLEVQDHGIGIAPEAQRRLFTPFVRAVSHRQFAGLGLGLYIARRIVEAHGGRVELVSAPGEGASFTVRLPLAD